MNPQTASSPDRQSAHAAYEAIAPVYDVFTAHHDYDLWIANLLPVLEANGLRGDRLLDVACGTGKSFLPMLRRGWKVTACDLSPSMLELARGKVGEEVELSVADVRELPELGEFDLIWALDDVVNYLYDDDQLVSALSRMRANLAPGGLITFDSNALYTFREFFCETESVEREGMRITWTGLGDGSAEPGCLGEARFEAEYLDASEGGPPIATHFHRQRHFPEPEVRAALQRAGLRCLAVYGHDHSAVPEQPLRELEHTKAIYVAAAAD